MTCSFLCVMPEDRDAADSNKTGSLIAGKIELNEVTKAAQSLGGDLGARRLTWIIVQNRATNSDGTVNATNILIGDSTQQTIELVPGAATDPLPIHNLSDVYAKSL